MSWYVVDDSSGVGLAIIECIGFAPQRHYGPPPSYNGKMLKDASKLIKFQAYIHLTTYQRIDESNPPEFYFDFIEKIWKTPVPSPIKQYWQDQNTKEWKDNSINSAPVNTKLEDFRRTPELFWVVEVDPEKESLIVLEELAKAKIDKKRELDRKFLIESRTPFAWTNGKSYQVTDDLSSGLNVINAGKTSIDWTAADNTRSSFTAQEFKDLCTAIFDRGQQKFLIKRVKKAEIDALTSIEAINNYDINNGWE